MNLRTRLAALLATLGGVTALLFTSGTSAGGEQPIEIDVPAPELVGSLWLNAPNGKPIKLASRKGRVTIVQFFAFGCINCVHNLPSYSKWQKQFKKDNVILIGVHTPETESERDPDNLIRFVKKNNITYPILMDTEGKNWNRWSQQFWPTVYLIDKWGTARYRWEGELEWEDAGGEKKMAAKIRELLAEK